MSATIQTNYPQQDTNQMQKLILRDLFFTFYGKNPEWDEKIDAAYKKHFGKELDPIIIPKNPIPRFLLGSPGQGKTSCVKSALKQFGEEIGLTVHINPDISLGGKGTWWPTKSDLILMTQELSGAVSSTEFGGLPTKVEREIGVDDDGNPQKEEYLAKAKYDRFMMFKAAAGGVLLLDDLPNASPSIQNVALSIAEERRFEGLDVSNALVVLTGNLGSKDGTNISRVSTALLNRCSCYHVIDTWENFKARAQREFDDRLADAGVLGFIEANQEDFNPGIEQRDSQFPSSRTWVKLINDFRVIMHNESGGTQDQLMAASNEMMATAQSLIGLKVGTKMASYFYAMMTGAEPVAKGIMELQMKGDKLEELPKHLQARMEEMLDGNKKLNAEGQDFGYQLATSVASKAAFELGKTLDIKDEEKREKAKSLISKKLSFGILQVGHGPNRALAIHEMAQRLVNLGKQEVLDLPFKTKVMEDLQELSRNGKVKISEQELKSVSAALSKMDAWNTGVSLDDLPDVAPK